MNMDTTPLEAGLDYFIRFDKVSCIKRGHYFNQLVSQTLLPLLY